MAEEEEDNLENEIKIVYLRKDDIPEIQIYDKNKMCCDGMEYKISDYINKINEKIKKIKDINDNSIDLIDDNNYDICGICKYNLNEYFCENCNKNICKNCYKNCKEEGHKIQNFEEIKNKFKFYANLIRAILKRYFIPLKEEGNIINEINLNINKDLKDNNDILFMYNITSLDYNNYFHYKNIEKIFSYCIKNYLIISKQNNYEGKGKKIFYNGTYYILLMVKWKEMVS